MAAPSLTWFLFLLGAACLDGKRLNWDYLTWRLPSNMLESHIKEEEACDSRNNIYRPQVQDGEDNDLWTRDNMQLTVYSRKWKGIRELSTASSHVTVNSCSWKRLFFFVFAASSN